MTEKNRYENKNREKHESDVFTNDIIGWVPHYGREMRDQRIVEGFFNTANLIYENLIRQLNNYGDEYIYPFLHSIRHTYEVQLKLVIFKMHEFYIKYKKGCISFGEKTYEDIKYTHDIGKLYDFINKNFFLLDVNKKKKKTVIKSIYNLIKDFLPEKEQDPYRYSEDRAGKENLSDLNQVPFKHYVNSLNKFKNKSDILIFFLDELDKNYKLNTYYKNISRYQITLIAKELPNYNKWKLNSFDETKTTLKRKYSLSSKDLTQIIEIIKKSRWLSYYIDYSRKDFSKQAKLITKCFKIITKEEKEKKRKKIDAFIDKLTKEEMIDIYTYYLMGREEYSPENYDEALEDSKNLFKEGKTRGNISYFREKFNGSRFVFFIMCGIFQSGDYELYLKLLNWIQKNTKIDCVYFNGLKTTLEKN